MSSRADERIKHSVLFAFVAVNTLQIGSNVGKNKKLLQEKNNLKWPEKKAKVLGKTRNHLSGWEY